MGFLSNPWKRTPADESAAPTSAAAMMRGNLIWKRMVSSVAGQVAEKWVRPILFRVIFAMSRGGMDTAPKAPARSRQTMRTPVRQVRTTTVRRCRLSVASTFRFRLLAGIAPRLKIDSSIISGAQCFQFQGNPCNHHVDLIDALGDKLISFSQEVAEGPP